MSDSGHGERVDLEQSVIESMSAVQTAVSVDMTVGQAVAELRSRRVTQPILYVYAVDDADRLVGVVPIRALLLGDPTAAIRDVMTARTVTIRASETVGDALMAFAMYRLLALPVVDDDGRLLGAVDVQIYADETFELAEAQRVHQLFQMLGVSVREARDRSPWRGFRSRMPWLCWNLVGGTACAIIAKVFDATLEHFIVLALFIPLVLTLAESVAMQSMTLVLEVLQGTEVRWRLIKRRMKTEAGTAVLLGLCCGGVVASTSMVFGGGLGVAAVLLGSISSTMILAATIGAGVPTILHALRLDPRIAAGPLSLTLTDMLATSVYLASATLFLMKG
ncbi:MAG: magnesium transporter [Phycisphaerae bacterium]|jgi:magnesium transporter|nr:magnesium transporter [Phycisphaerae bacterium]